MRENIVERLAGGDVLLLDGGTGSELQRRGVEVLHGSGETRRLAAWSALANVEAADVVRQVHTDYLRVGADAIISNSFWTGPTRMASVGLADDWERYARAAGENAVAARDAANTDAYVLAGIAPPAISSVHGQQTQSDVIAMGATAFRKEYGDQARALASCGVDAILAEYVGCIDEAVASVAACSATGLPVLLGIRHIQEDGTMQYGERLEDLAAALRDSPVAGIMLMCTAPERISAGLPRLIDAYDGPVGAYPNIGYMPLAPVDPDKPTMTNQLPSISGDFLQTADYYPTRLAEFAREWKEMGARIIGGCCATGPEHVMAMAPVVKQLP
jgi:homocysteine S-methyltransferase